MSAGRIALWAFLFPIMLPYWLFKTGRTDWGILCVVCFVLIAVLAPGEEPPRIIWPQSMSPPICPWKI